MTNRVSRTLVAIAGIAACAAVGSANAAIIGAGVSLTAGPDTVVIPFGAFTPSGGGFFDYNNPSIVFPNGSEITNLFVTYVDDPSGSFNIFVDFGATTGALGSSFVISTGLLTFAPMLDQFANASAGFSLSDDVGGATTASMTAGHGDLKAYHANYNGASVFASHVGSYALPTLTGSGTTPSTMIPGFTSSMSVEMRFSLGADDSVGVTSQYEIVPAPGALALLGLGGLVAGRRRR